MAYLRKKPAAIGIKAKYPGFIEPALATPIAKVPSGDLWVHGIKFDGYRVHPFYKGDAQTEADHFGNCPVCGAYLDMRDLGQMLAHVPGEEIGIGEGQEPPPRPGPSH